MRQVSIGKHKNNRVTKANSLIEAKGILSENASKMVSMMVSMIKQDDSEFQEYAMNIQDFLNSIKSSSKNTNAVKRTAEELMNNPFWLEGKLFNWCSSADITRMEGYIVFDVHRYLRPYLLDLKTKFTSYDIINILTLKGDYSPRLYEYLIMRFDTYKSKVTTK